MELTFNDIVDYCRNMSLSEKRELKQVIEKDIVSDERVEMLKDCAEGMEEYKSGTLKSSGDINELKKIFNEL
jgi:hypothetical protein